MVAFLICKKEFIGYKPMNPAYPEKLETLGDHLRKVRLDRGLYLSDVAKALGVTNDSINNWENNHCEPRVSQVRKIITFIGYFPFDLSDLTLGKALLAARQIAGLSQKRLGRSIMVDPKTLSKIEMNNYKPFEITKKKCEDFISTHLTKDTFESIALHTESKSPLS